MRRIGPGVATLVALVLIGATLRLGMLERSGPTHVDLELGNGVPATFYLPEPHDPGRFGLPEPPPLDARPPGVVVMHGFAADRVMMSVLARRLALAGHAVIAIDARGHGANRTPFPTGAGRPDAFFDDLAAAVAFLRTSPWVDGSRIALVGHSMGAGAVLDFATRDPSVDGVIAISGARTPAGPYPPPNTLLLWAEGDPARIRSAAPLLAQRLAGDPRLVAGVTGGDPARGTAVRAFEAPGTDHLSVIFDEDATQEVIAWLDTVFARTSPEGIAHDPRLRVFGIAMFAFLLTLPGVGWIAGRLAPRFEPRPLAPALGGFAILALALLLGLAIVSAGSPAGFVSMEVGDPVASLFAAAGLLAWLALTLDARTTRLSGFHEPRRALRQAVGPGLVGFATIWLALTPIGVVGHRLVPTAERWIAGCALTLLLLPFFVAFELLLRRGTALTATLCGVAGRVLVLGMLVLGVSLGTLPPVVGLMIPVFALLSIGFESFALGAHVAGRNPFVIAVTESAWLGMIMAALLPIRV